MLFSLYTWEGFKKFWCLDSSWSPDVNTRVYGQLSSPFILKHSGLQRSVLLPTLFLLEMDQPRSVVTIHFKHLYRCLCSCWWCMHGDKFSGHVTITDQHSVDLCHRECPITLILQSVKYCWTPLLNPPHKHLLVPLVWPSSYPKEITLNALATGGLGIFQPQRL